MFECAHAGCAYKSLRRDYIEQHARTHSGERPYQCSECAKAFAQKGDLTIHARTHTGMKPYACVACNKAFSKSGHLVRHARLHAGDPEPATTAAAEAAVDASRAQATQEPSEPGSPLGKQEASFRYACHTDGCTFGANSKTELAAHKRSASHK